MQRIIKVKFILKSFQKKALPKKTSEKNNSNPRKIGYYFKQHFPSQRFAMWAGYAFLASFSLAMMVLVMSFNLHLLSEILR